jgi:transposase
VKHMAANLKEFPPITGNVAPAERAVPGDESISCLSKCKKGLPYSADLRARVISAVYAGASCQKVAAQYGLNKSTVGKWVLRFRQTGGVAAKPMGGDRFSRLKDEREWILARIAAEPGMTSAELHQELCARGVRVGYLSVRRFLKKEKIELG